MHQIHFLRLPSRGKLMNEVPLYIRRYNWRQAGQRPFVLLHSAVKPHNDLRMSRRATKWKQSRERGSSFASAASGLVVFQRIHANCEREARLPNVTAISWVHSKHEQNKPKQWAFFLTEWLNTGSRSSIWVHFEPTHSFPPSQTKHQGSICIFICYFWVAGR